MMTLHAVTGGKLYKITGKTKNKSKVRKGKGKSAKAVKMAIPSAKLGAQSAAFLSLVRRSRTKPLK